MVEAEGVSIKFEAEVAEFKRVIDDVEKRMKKLEERGKKAKKEGLGAMGAAAIGGAAGFVASAVNNNEATKSVMDLLLNIMAAALLPVLIALLPAIQGVADFAVKLGEFTAKVIDFVGADAASAALIAGYLGGKLGGPLVAIAAAVTALAIAKVGDWWQKNALAPLTEEERRARGQPPKEIRENTTYVGGDGEPFKREDDKVVRVGVFPINVDRIFPLGPEA